MATLPKMHERVLSWATDLDTNTLEQAETTARMPFVNKPLALMADAHLGKGSTVGSVVATKGAIMPACVGVDIGCGMIAQKLSYPASDLGPHLDDIHERISDVVPAGIPTSTDRRAGSHRLKDEVVVGATSVSCLEHLIWRKPETADMTKTVTQFGTLGSGNHFVEICSDELGDAWLVLHSGSRNPGNTIARHHIGKAQGLMKDWFIELEDPDLAYLVEGTEPFQNYIDDMHWAQDYAFANRQAMVDAIRAALAAELHEPLDQVYSGVPINCHHNYTAIENHHGRNMWITRKGAIQAREGTLGVIPGSMATGSFIVEGLGSPASYCSASHGAGRRMSRNQAKRVLTPDSLDVRMAGISWNRDPDSLLDEHPDAYKDLTQVMQNQSKLVKIRHNLTTILNYKGT